MVATLKALRAHRMALLDVSVTEAHNTHASDSLQGPHLAIKRGLR